MANSTNKAGEGASKKKAKTATVKKTTPASKKDTAPADHKTIGIGVPVSAEQLKKLKEAAKKL